MNNLTCQCLPRLDGASEADLDRLFPEPSSAAPLLALLQESGMDGFKLRSIVVFQDDTPILMLPLFETRFDLSAFVGGWTKTMVKVAGRLVPSLVQPRILGVGMVVGEWSEIGVDPQIDAGTLEAAFTMAFDALKKLAAELKSDIVTLYNFTHFGGLPGKVLDQFNRVKSQSCARMPIDFNSLEEFLARHSRAARKSLRRKMRFAPDIRILRSRDIAPYLDRIYQLYLATVARSPMAFGTHNRLFFEQFCARVPNSEYTLYFVRDELIAFNLLVVKQESMVDKYFCMDFVLGRKYQLYFLSWLENIRICAERGIPLYHSGQGAEITKAHLGATLIPIDILFKHRRPLINRLLVAWPKAIQRVLNRLGFWPAALPTAPDAPLPVREGPVLIRRHNTIDPASPIRRGEFLQRPNRPGVRTIGAAVPWK